MTDNEFEAAKRVVRHKVNELGGMYASYVSDDMVASIAWAAVDAAEKERKKERK